MAFEHDQVIRAQYDRLTGERARLIGEYEQARLHEDADNVMLAADRINEIDAKFAALNQVANNLIASQQRAAPANKFGLNADEQEIARGIATGDRTMTNDDRQKLYAEQKSRYQHLRATGQYVDHRGSMKR